MSFSGSAWWDHKSVIQKIKDTSGGPFRIYADVGGAEDTSMIDDNKLAFQAYVDKGYVEGKTLMTQIYPGGVHHGTSWAKRVPDAFTFALGPGR